ncbi:MAG: hypothetical protein CO139_00825 [Candidatus Moranbacteria bacterium CG_4_9_14_3_um_filter_36_9]|nr:MAG: hypothetical protein CO139_00825 [Candidatus Moranbacteria bacterium CG_4_9_14_3_um_filter_36_9]
MEFIKKNFLVIFILILLLGTALRVYNLSGTSFSADEFLGVNTAYGYAKTGEWRRWDFNLNKLSEDRSYAYTIFDFGNKKDAEEGNYIRAWMYNGQIAKVLNFLPASKESSFRLVSVLWGIVSLFLLYFIAKFFTKNRIIGLLSAFLFAISISGIIFDRNIRMYAMLFPFYLMFSYLFYQFLEGEKNFGYSIIDKLKKITGLNFVYLIPLAVIGLVSLHLHLLSVNIFPAVFVYIIANAIIEFRKTGKKLNRYSNYIILAGALFVIFLLAFPRQFAPILMGIEFENHFSYIIRAFSDYASAILAFGTMILGIIYLNKNHKKESLFLVSSLVVPFFLAIFVWNRSVGDQYIFFIKSFLIILIASGIYFLAEFFGKTFSQNKLKIELATIILALIIIPNYAYFFQENNTYRQTSSSDSPNYKKVFGYYLKHQQDGDVLVTRWFRNYYFSDANARVETFGGEREDKDIKKMTGERLAEIQKNNSCGWFIWADNDDDFITADAKDYARKNFEFINDIAVRGKITVNHWCDK